MLAVDPGGVHVGLALFRRDPAGVWRCTWAGEATPDEFADALAQTVATGSLDVLVYERFIVEPARASALAGSELETSQLIGVIRWLVRHSGEPDRWPAGRIELVGQTNKIKRATRAVLKNRHVKSTAKLLGVRGDHATDAELHGYHHIIKTLGEGIAPPSV